MLKYGYAKYVRDALPNATFIGFTGTPIEKPDRSTPAVFGKTIDTYEDVQSLGIETLRNLYTSAGLAIRPKTQVNRIEQLKEIIRAWGQNPEEILTKDALMRGNITELPDQTQNHQLSLLAEQLKQLIKKEVSE